MKRYAVAFLILAGCAAWAAEPPEYLSYQGVLRDSSNGPLDGDYDMGFRFYDAEANGTLLLADLHTDIAVDGGQFRVHLGSGTITPGAHSSLSEVFANEVLVYMEVQVETDVPMIPRIRIISAGYSLNASRLDGRDSSGFLDTSTGTQTKPGTLRIEATTGNEVGLEVFADDSSDSIEGMAARFQNKMAGPQTQVSLAKTESTGEQVAVEAVAKEGPARASSAGKFVDDLAEAGASVKLAQTTATGEKVGVESKVKPIHSKESSAGKFVEDTADPGTSVKLALTQADGVKRAIDAVAKPPSGMAGTAGMFSNDSVSPSARVKLAETKASGQKIGISAQAADTAGVFADDEAAPHAMVQVGHTDGAEKYGVWALGTTAGGYFHQNLGADYGGEAWVAFTLGTDNYGIWARGEAAGGRFWDRDGSGVASVAAGEIGIEADGNAAGGHFTDPNSTGDTFVAIGDQGINAVGSLWGGYFNDTDTSSNAKVATGTYKILGTGSVSFVQNHPVHPGLVIVYAAPEGDEVATYTRGTARLIGDEARVSLGETFRWVTNPDVGLTAHVTPRGEWADLYVESLSTDELVVRSRDHAVDGIVFDYLVYGLRIGFEQVSVVQERTEEAYIPSMAEHLALYQRRPDLIRFNAFERFRAMSEATGRPVTADLSETDALRDAVVEFDPGLHPANRAGAALEREAGAEESPDAGSVQTDGISAAQAEEDTVARGDPKAGAAISGGMEHGKVPMDERGNVYGASFRPEAPELAGFLPVSHAVIPGDVLVVDRDRPGVLRAADRPADPGVVGIVSDSPGLLLGHAPPSRAPSEGESAAADVSQADSLPMEESDELPWGHAPVALSGIVSCNVDAGFGAIRIGDLLTTSPTAGHAMLSRELVPGTIVGKALEPLDAGTGRIKILVMPR